MTHDTIALAMARGAHTSAQAAQVKAEQANAEICALQAEVKRLTAVVFELTAAKVGGAVHIEPLHNWYCLEQQRRK